MNRQQDITGEFAAVYDDVAWGEEAFVMFPIIAPGQTFTSADISRGLNDVRPYYITNTSYTTNFGTRYGLRRQADVVGVAYWSWHARANSQPVGGVAFNSAFFDPNTLEGGDLTASTNSSPSKPFRTGPFNYSSGVPQTSFWFDRVG